VFSVGVVVEIEVAVMLILFTGYRLLAFGVSLTG